MPKSPLALKRVVEYPLPAASQTHEIVSPCPGLLLVSQQPSSVMVKMRVDPCSGRPLESVAHTIDNPFAGLHGLTVSKRHPGFVWATLQFQSELLLIDPVADDLNSPPRIVQRITLPAPARGPHVVVEDGENLWTSCKDSHHVVQVSTSNPAQHRIIPCPPRPIFVQVHPSSGDVYATLDQSSALLHIPRNSESATVLSIPASQGSTPVGMVPGPDGNLWFGLLGSASGGTGTFGRINANAEVEWFKLSSGPAMGAAFIHLGFPPVEDGQERIHLLASSMASMMALNAVVEVSMSQGYGKVEAQQTLAFPSQGSMSHRVLCTKQGVYVTELGACAVAHLHPARSPYGEGINELADPYALWGCGVPAASVKYPDSRDAEDSRSA